MENNITLEKQMIKEKTKEVEKAKKRLKILFSDSSTGRWKIWSVVHSQWYL